MIVRASLDIRRWFVIALLFFLNITILGCLFLLVAGKIAP